MVSPEDFNKIFNDRFAETVGFKLVSVNEKESIYEMVAQEKHWNPNGVVHGGALFAMMDSSQGALVHFVMDLKQFFGTTAEATIRYRKPMTKGKVTVRTTITEKKRNIMYVRTEAMDESGDILAELTEKWMILSRSRLA